MHAKLLTTPSEATIKLENLSQSEAMIKLENSSYCDRLGTNFGEHKRDTGDMDHAGLFVILSCENKYFVAESNMAQGNHANQSLQKR